MPQHSLKGSSLSPTFCISMSPNVLFALHCCLSFCSAPCLIAGVTTSVGAYLLHGIQASHLRAVPSHLPLEISNHVGINRKYLTKLFNEKMDNSPKNYLIQYRINKACRLLKQSTLSIQEVSHSVGYTDALVFSKIFKKVVGTCPREYRSANFTS